MAAHSHRALAKRSDLLAKSSIPAPQTTDASADERRVLNLAARYVLKASGLVDEEASAEALFSVLAEAVQQTAFTRDWELRYQIMIPAPTPSNNVIKGMQWFAYRDLRRAWRDHIWAGLNGRLPREPLGMARVVVNRHSSGMLDWDNALGGLKVLFDCLVVPTKRNPDGLGLILDDNPSVMPEPPYMRQAETPRGEGFTECLIYAPRN